MADEQKQTSGCYRVEVIAQLFGLTVRRIQQIKLTAKSTLKKSWN